jgi:hypothetical protein
MVFGLSTNVCYDFSSFSWEKKKSVCEIHAVDRHGGNSYKISGSRILPIGL